MRGGFEIFELFDPTFGRSRLRVGGGKRQHIERLGYLQRGRVPKSICETGNLAQKEDPPNDDCVLGLVICPLWEYCCRTGSSFGCICLSERATVTHASPSLFFRSDDPVRVTQDIRTRLQSLHRAFLDPPDPARFHRNRHASTRMDTHDISSILFLNPGLPFNPSIRPFCLQTTANDVHR